MAPHNNKNFSDKVLINRKSTPVNILPTEILLYIFSFLSNIEILDIARHVCRRWNLLTPKPTLDVKRLRIADSKSQNTRQICDIINSSPKLKDVTISCRSGLSRILKTIGKASKDLRKLKIINGGFCERSKCSAGVNKIVKKCKKLHRIGILANRYYLRRSFKLSVKQKTGRLWSYKSTMDIRNIELNQIPTLLLGLRRYSLEIPIPSSSSVVEEYLRTPYPGYQVAVHRESHLEHFLSLVNNHTSLHETDVLLQVL
ncbi:hypothetical protein PPYR_01366 [Photinus pyralis]|uniref:F-box domain-containing protein n=1 Tax=Photinus pyralis TaxID=7054 RepID=A0A5N4B4A2_PHOPY|nr:uncharacterized protein LOC116160132 [Photinus pyralis]XP_031338162.1 uncharacterized protein LOC116167065 [Photinus pyralis]KAB0800471.1 hypothetical protein PPYR_06211 [Photinus pyralis]KAB0804396.1 hypothetical protein PPYR_01366 [Photinus pyralis]